MLVSWSLRRSMGRVRYATIFPTIKPNLNETMTRNKSRKKAPAQHNAIRIIGGQWRSRKISFADVPGLRPSGDRLRETLFNWLGPQLPGARCLDLFAGSGALGLEAMSRGANSCELIEKSGAAYHAIRRNCEALGAGNAVQVVQADALQWLRQGPQSGDYDIIFLDPPFGSTLLENAIAKLCEPGWLAPSAHIYLEMSRQQATPTPRQWQLLRSSDTSEVHCQLFAVGSE